MSNRKKIKTKKSISKKRSHEGEEKTSPLMTIFIILAVIIILLGITLFRNGVSSYDYYPGKWFDDIRRYK